VNDLIRRLRPRPALVIAACAAVGLCFAARAQQKPGLPPPAGPMQEEGEADDAISPDELVRALREAEAESDADGGVPALPAEVMQVPAAATNAVVQHVNHPQGFELWKKAKLVGGAYQARTEDGKSARLSVDPHLQDQMAKLLKMYRPVAAAVVALDPKSGKVLAMAEYGEGAATKPLYPAASIFKIITGAALLEKGVSPDVETCYHGGMHGIVAKMLQDKPNLDRRCLSLSMALARSANVVFAKMAVKHLDGDDLRKQAERFLFNKPIFDQPVGQSSAEIPTSGGLDFAKSAAGFGQVMLSPMHAALIAAAVGNGGVAEEPSFIDEVDGADVPGTGSMRLMNPETAVSLREMMKLTVSSGTATSSFRERHRNILGDIEVAGKTGSLSTHKGPFKDYSWFVGFAPAGDPKIAVAVVVVNGLKWRVHAPYIAREALKAYLVGGPLGQPPIARRVKHHRRRKRL
jgi:peptidoglycan glycosyltransferase